MCVCILSDSNLVMCSVSGGYSVLLYFHFLIFVIISVWKVSTRFPIFDLTWKQFFSDKISHCSAEMAKTDVIGTGEEVICCLFYQAHNIAAVLSVLGSSYMFSQKECSNGKQLLWRAQSNVVSVCSKIAH